jgi:hypothetical protein
VYGKNSNWSDDYWLLVLQLYLSKPEGVKPMYSKATVNLGLEIHIQPEVIFAREREIDNLETPRLERIWETYSESPRKLSRAVKLLREMKGFNHADEFYEGVTINETFERDFRPISDEVHFTPVMLILILNLYFQLTPITMGAETPEVAELAKLIGVTPQEVAEVLQVYQICDPYLNRNALLLSPLVEPCTDIWRRYDSIEPEQLTALASQLEEYFKK